jgi:general secretion pathway protein K
MDLPKDQITIASHYFLAVAEASSDNFNLKVYSLIKRSKNKEGKITSSIIRESINGF